MQPKNASAVSAWRKKIRLALANGKKSQRLVVRFAKGGHIIQASPYREPGEQRETLVVRKRPAQKYDPRGKCPFCRSQDCEHFIGWTEDGLSVGDDEEKQAVLPTDRLINTGATVRVYRRL